MTKMKEIQGNIWDYYKKKDIAICITTNAIVKENGDLVCGAGCAKEAARKIPNFTRLVGLQVFAWGNHVYHIKHNVFTFPVKQHYANKARLSIIERSCQELVKMLRKYDYKKIIVPRPGCGNGRLLWKDVKLILEKYFDDRFYIIKL